MSDGPGVTLDQAIGLLRENEGVTLVRVICPKGSRNSVVTHIMQRPFRFGLVFIVLVAVPQFVNAQLIIAHRGASHDAPENTLAAFRQAWILEADGIEGDFRLTRDGQIVCIHDETTERTTGVNLEVARTNLAELRRLDAGRWMNNRFAGQRIPTLTEVLETVPAGKRMVIELKSGPEIVAPLKRVLDAATLQSVQVLVISFEKATIAESKRVLPEIRAHWLSGYEPDDDTGPWTPTADQIAQSVNASGAEGFGSEARRSVFQPEFWTALQKAGITEFHVWTVDEPDDARYFQRMGAWGITTNRPDLIRQALDDTSR